MSATSPRGLAPPHRRGRPTITPGVFNPAVRQGTIRKTICKSGWTKTIRPPVSYTNALKLMQMVQYGEDHFTPLELGGAPKNPKNLWPEPHSQSSKSDPLETSYGSRLASKGRTARQIADVMGHEKSSTTEICVQRFNGDQADEDIRQAMTG